MAVVIGSSRVTAGAMRIITVCDASRAVQTSKYHCAISSMPCRSTKCAASASTSSTVAKAGSAAASPTTAAYKPSGTAVDFYTLSDKAWIGRPKLDMQEIEGIDSGGATYL